ncbi:BRASSINOSTEROID INSENSITIVE 1-associated receptor kinase 1 precursor [Dorcoceras hygrometricum]|uniref:BRASSINOSTEROID INSENSITIVE 1-associated receptor kinase 1 n=1 Tax=Dorcoceras hygrometricum TaxID=472368 RepID=A0A2Z7AEK6_9LAMI|nr:BRASSINOSTEROID INSENSITIVE 1-associated receptor kinase 1 precursor [Dorcoceras hygrometricum]
MAAPPPRARERARWRDCRAMAAHDARPVGAALGDLLRNEGWPMVRYFAPLLCATMVETLRCWSRALAARWPGGAASLVARKGAIGAFIVHRCWTSMSRCCCVDCATLAGGVPPRATCDALRARPCVALGATSRAAVVRILRVAAAPAGRRSGDAPAMS